MGYEVEMFEISILENIQFHAKFLRANNGFVRVFNLGDLLDFSRRDTEILLYDTILETMTQGWDCRDDSL